MSTIDHLSELFLRDLPKLRIELEGYLHEEDIWIVPEGINNSAGNLSLHISGNLRHYIGAVLGDDGYERDREFEFNGKTDLNALIDDIDKAQSAIHTVLSSMSRDDLEKPFPLEMFGGTITNGLFLIHLYGHMNYHIGQVNYHRRLIQ
jgi:uncharacterized damage-inducible protein DinB